MTFATFPEKLSTLPAIPPKSRLVNVVVDTPRGARCKYKYDEGHGAFRVSKLLPAGMSFPHAFGFVPSTKGEDGDPLDVLILCDEPLIVGSIATVRLVGVLKAEQVESGGDTARNDRLIGSLETSFNPPAVRRLADLGTQHCDEVEHFFVTYNELAGRAFRPLGWAGAAAARQILEKGVQQGARTQARPPPTGKRPQTNREAGNRRGANGATDAGRARRRHA